MLYELNDSLDKAAQDNNCKVIVLAAEGPDFSSGHDMKDREPMTHKPVGTWGGFNQPGIEGHWAFEEELYLGFCWRWRNIPKPTIVEVQGRVIAAGLMLVWRRRAIFRSGGRLRSQWSRILRAPMGSRGPKSQGNAIYRRSDYCPGS